MVQMEWRQTGLSLCLPLVILPSTIESRISFLLAPAHLVGPGKRAVEWLWLWCEEVGCVKVVWLQWCNNKVHEVPGSYRSMGICVYHNTDIYNKQPWAWSAHPYYISQLDSAFYHLWDNKMSAGIWAEK